MLWLTDNQGKGVRRFSRKQKKETCHKKLDPFFFHIPTFQLKSGWNGPSGLHLTVVQYRASTLC